MLKRLFGIAIISLPFVGLMFSLVNTASAALDLSFNKDYVDIGGSVTVTVTGASGSNRDSNAVETLGGSIVVKNKNTGETINLVLTETGADTSIFRGSYSVTSGSSASGLAGNSLPADISSGSSTD